MRQLIRSDDRDTDVVVKLSDAFKKSRRAPIDLAGQLVHMMYELAPIETKADLHIEFRRSSPSRPQALRLKVRGGQLSLNDQLLNDVALWSDTVPKGVDAVLVPESEGQPMSLRVWNAWRDRSGTMQAWIGNAGIVVEEATNRTVLLCCSDGYGEPRFDDLQVELTIRLPETPGHGASQQAGADPPT